MSFKRFFLKGVICSLLLICISVSIFADNWVCYDTTGKATSSQLRAHFKWQTGSPLQIIRTNKKVAVYTVSPEFRACGSQKSLIYCPENEYYLKSVFENPMRCVKFGGAHHYQYNVIPGVDCGLGGGPYCRKFVSLGLSSKPVHQTFVCGKNNNSWQVLNVNSAWKCPDCEILARRYSKEPIMENISSFRDLSFGGSYFKKSNTSLDIYFMVYILACVNRVPMLNLKIDLIDKSLNKSVKEMFGIYAKHETLDYNAENLGKLEGLVLPEQEVFRKKYIINATLNGYRGWAWRTRFVEAVKRVVKEYGLGVPGFPTNDNQSNVFDNLYYSDDFMTSLNVNFMQTLNSSKLVHKVQEGSINVLKNIGFVNGQRMCTVYDLKNYVRSYGLTNNLLKEVGKVIPLIDGANYTKISISKAPDEILKLSPKSFVVDSKNESSKYWIIKYYIDRHYYYSLYNYLKRNGLINEYLLKNEGKRIVSSWYDYSPNLGCYWYDYKIGSVWINDAKYRLVPYTYKVGKYVPYHDPFLNMTFYKWVYVNKTAYRMYVNISFKAKWINDILAMVKLVYEKVFDQSYSWNFASFSDLDPIDLAKCLYNWDKCLLRKVGKYKEVADCGLGPPSSLAEPSMKDGARGQKSITQEVVVYKNCVPGKDWISKSKVYACVNGRYYKCFFGLSADEVLLGVTHADFGDTLSREGKKGFVCVAPGIWKEIDCNGHS